MTTVVANESALRTAIQRKLVGLAQQGRFFKARYDADGLPDGIDPDTADRIVPASIASNEVTAEFGPDEQFGRAVHQRRTAWQFELHLGFDHEVVFSFFEQDNAAPVPRVDATDFHTYALLRLTNAEYDHPARNAAGGSSAILTWQADIGR